MTVRIGRCESTQDNAVRYKATLTFKRSELLYDIKNSCYIEGHVMSDESKHSKHMTQDVGEGGNIDRVGRLLNLYHAQAVEMLYAFSKQDMHVAEEAVPWNDELTEPEEYRIDLLLPEGFSQTTINLLEQLIHEWMVASVVAEWLSITNPEKHTLWLAKAEEMKDKIRKSMLSRTSVVSRRLSPF